jgi:hypothetical protein
MDLAIGISGLCALCGLVNVGIFEHKDFLFDSVHYRHVTSCLQKLDNPNCKLNQTIETDGNFNYWNFIQCPLAMFTVVLRRAY